jgi:hypothetical protein
VNSDEFESGAENAPSDHGKRGPDHQAKSDRHSACLIHYLFFDHDDTAGRPLCRKLDDFAFRRALSHVMSAFVLGPGTSKSTNIV